VYEREPFGKFLRRLDWRQGEHLFIAAPTQCGKTSLASILVARRNHVVVLSSKPGDDNLRKRYADYRRISEWPPDREADRVLLWPRQQSELSRTIIVQRAAFKKCLDSVSRQRGWCVVVDEAHWCSQFLRLDREIAVLHHQGSSTGISMVTLSQRPAWIPRIIYSSASHVFLGATHDRDDAKSLANLGGVDMKEVADTMARMGRHDLLYLNPMGTARAAVVNIRR
jgi:hypothetical protein